MLTKKPEYTHRMHTAASGRTYPGIPGGSFPSNDARKIREKSIAPIQPDGGDCAISPISTTEAERG